jgi:hypothetical protein
MGQNFFPDTVNQTLLFPPSLHDGTKIKANASKYGAALAHISTA